MKLVKEDSLWIAERRGLGVYVRKGKAKTSPVPKATTFATEALAAAYLEEQYAARLAEGYVLVDPAASIDAPFTLDGRTAVPAPIPDRYRAMDATIRALVASGFVEPDEITWFIDDAIGRVVRPPSNLRAALERSADSARMERRQRSKPEPCVNDALDAAFDELNRRGIVALQNAGAKIGRAPDDARAAAILEAKRRRARGEMLRGFCVYGVAELERAVRGEGLSLDVGTFVKADGAAPTLVREVLKLLQARGVDARGSGNEDSPLIVPPFAWYR